MARNDSGARPKSRPGKPGGAAVLGGDGRLVQEQAPDASQLNLSASIVYPTGGSTGRTLADWSGALVATIAASTYTILESDHGKALLFTAGATVTVPAGLPVNFTCGIVQAGASQVTVAASGVTINEPDSHLKTEKQWVMLSLMATALNTYLLTGRTAA